jgi:hypothetical protein
VPVTRCCPPSANGVWDQHGKLKEGHEKNAFDVDQPIAGLLKDLKRRGLLDETLVLFASEFGRTPHTAGSGAKAGRDHHPEGFTVWLADGVKGGTIYGATDELGMRASENLVNMHDLHATLLHALGLDHERLTYRFGGRGFRLTDTVGGRGRLRRFWILPQPLLGSAFCRKPLQPYLRGRNVSRWSRS